MDKRILIRKTKVNKGFVKNGGAIYTMKCMNCGNEFDIKGGEYNRGLGKTCSPRCRNILIGNTLSGRAKSAEHRKKLSEALKGKVKGKDNSNYGNRYTEETKKKISNKIREFYRKNPTYKSKGFTGKKHTDKTKAVMSKRRKGIKKSIEFKKKVSGKNSYRYGKPPAHGKGEWYIRKDKTKIWMRSSYEIKFAKWLDRKNLTWQYEPKRFYLKDRTYAPDFYVKEWNKWIEIKGWFHKRHQETIRQFKELNPKLAIEVLTKDILISKYNLNI